MRLVRLPLPPRLLSAVLFATSIASVSLSSFLSFTVQPLVGKLLLPIQGGTASTWLGVMLYFQIALLLGYSWAAWLLRRQPKVQVAAMALLGLAAMVTSRLDWIQETRGTGVGSILFTLTCASLPAMVLLFCTAPLMHGWLRGRERPVPYHLYAFSNAGSLIAVLLYPFTIERLIGLSDQIFYWHGLVWVMTGLVGASGFIFMVTASYTPKENSVRELIPFRRVVTWLGLSILSCIGMLGATYHLTAEIGSSPLTWVGPLGAFLMSFLIIFSGYWQPRFTRICLGWLAVSLTGFMLTKGIGPAPVEGWVVFWLFSLSAAGSFLCNGLIHENRPSQRFTFFYLVLALGGALGGLFVTIVAPILFLRPSEFIVVSSILLVLGLMPLVTRKDVLSTLIVLLVVLSPVMGLAFKQSRDESTGMLHIRRFRNLYGYKMLKYEENGLILSSETTTHGTQLTASPEARLHPTLYYTENSGVGRVITRTKELHPSINIGVVGLGAGTLASYLRRTDAMVFWDIDPNAIKIARDFFTFLRDSAGDIRILEEDGRKGLQSSNEDYDLLVIDAFCGDAIPLHLLTKEALSIYFRRVERRKGVVVIHGTNRYNSVFPVIGATANELGWRVISVVTEFEHTTEAEDWDGVVNQYIIVSPPERTEEIVAWLPLSEDGGRVRRILTKYEPLPRGEAIIWTDDRHAAIDSLDLSRYLGFK